MKVIHHSLANGSGLNRVATSMVQAERKLGIESFLCYVDKPENTEGNELALPLSQAKEADVHVIHAHLPDGCEGKTVFVPHGTPEYCFAMAIDQNHKSGFWAGDPFMLSLYRLNNSDITVTFWDRHKYIWQSMSPKASVRVIPMGIDTDFWKPVEAQGGKWGGEPSLLTCENPHQIKWPLDIFLAFPILIKRTKAVLHAHYLPMDQHRFWYPLLSANGTSFRAFTSGSYMDNISLRNAFVSCDYYLNLVRYGDFNSVGLEAKACGCKVISYKGNPYADFCIEEGSQIEMAEELIQIFEGKVEPNKTIEIVSLEVMANEMVKIYESLA